MINKICLVLFIIFLYFKVFKGAIFVNNQQFQCYGITNEIDIKALVRYVSICYSKGANPENLYKNLMEIASAESGLGSIGYTTTRGYGYGLFQFDRVAFDTIKAKIKTFDSGLFLMITQRLIDDIKYDDLKTQALTATFFARAYLYYRIPEKIGETIEIRARQWKQYYNTPLGKGTEQGYINKANLYFYNKL